MYSTRAASGSRPLIPPASAGLRTSPPASVLIPPDSSFLHRRIPDSRLIVAPRVPHITIQFLQGKGSLDLFSLDLPLPASCEPASVQGSPLQLGSSNWFACLSIESAEFLSIAALFTCEPRSNQDILRLRLNSEGPSMMMAAAADSSAYSSSSLSETTPISLPSKAAHEET
ncbi:hypothetical protein LshimejAT787_2200250 [Lyophyllum shimeji]|uniref:Uncharacterized protein n=1 Tax=Lyophyllum shimeji TaxID=47721 RepID=A0A9P3Q210_LYOSH|nr:hypothetical protein LshimejAT787_2200250 [Lyophyllum shimeji]